MKIEIFNEYVDKIANLYQMPKESIFSKVKKRELVDARHLLYYLCKDRNMEVSYIQRFMNNNGYDIGHSTIIYGMNVMKDKVNSDPDYKQIINKIK